MITMWDAKTLEKVSSLPWGISNDNTAQVSPCYRYIAAISDEGEHRHIEVVFKDDDEATAFARIIRNAGGNARIESN